MNPLLDSLQNSWLVVLCALLAAVSGGWWLLHRTRLRWLVASLALGCLATGDLFLSGSELPLWILAGVLFVGVVMLVVLILTGHWSAHLGWLLASLLGLALGGLVLAPVQEALAAAYQFTMSLDSDHKAWLWLLLVEPLLIALSLRSLAGLGPLRRGLIIGMRCASIAALILAIAEVQGHKDSDRLTVIFVWDRSLSMPTERAGKDDLRVQHLLEFINASVARRGADRGKDQVGLIVFGKHPRLELSPSAVPHLNLQKIVSEVENDYTDIAAALKLAFASFPEGSSKRIVLISDGNENLGRALEQARIARHNGVQIDVLPIIASSATREEVLVERIEVPTQVERDARVPLRILVRSYQPDVVVGTLTLYSSVLERAPDPEGGKDVVRAQPKLLIEQRHQQLRYGLNTFYVQLPPTKEEDSVTYTAKFEPTHVENAKGKLIQQGLPGDRWQNNAASASVIARGNRSILLVEPARGDHQLLVDRLKKEKKSLTIETLTPEDLPARAATLAVKLSKYDAVILANIPADKLSEEQQKVIRSNTHDQGCGLIMIGGPQSFGAGGWHNTEVEKALPVTCDLKSMKIEGKSGLVLIMHASEMADGNMWQKKIARLAVERLSPVDMVGVQQYGEGPNGVSWHIPFTEIGGNRDGILRRLDSLVPGDMPDAELHFQTAYQALAAPQYRLGTKHIIFISDGDPTMPAAGTLARIKNAKVTCTTVCVTSHGPGEVNKMAAIAAQTAGRAYHVTNPNQLPSIYIKESRLVSQSYVHEKPFQPLLLGKAGPTAGLPAKLKDLYGFVRTTKRPSPLVEVPIQTEKLGGYTFPLLAYWQYGLGKAIAFTSDALTREDVPKRFWDHDWANDPSGMHGQFWSQLVDYSLRAVESGRNLSLNSDYVDGKLRITIEARDDQQRPLTNVEIKVGISAPSFKERDPRLPEARFEQKNAGVYEAEVAADEIGAYLLNVQARWQENGAQRGESIRGAVTIPYSPEYAEMESNRALVENLARETNGIVYRADAAQLAEDARKVFRAIARVETTPQPLWHWLVLAAALCLFTDVALRRISLDVVGLAGRVQVLWAQLRRSATVQLQVGQVIERLQNRKKQVEQKLEKERAGRRFDAGAAPAPAAPRGADELPTAPPRPPEKSTPAASGPSVAPEQEEDAGDFFGRLQRRKKDVWKDRDKKPKDEG